MFKAIVTGCERKRIQQAGDPLPDATLFEGDPETKVSIKQLFGNKKGVLFAVPGAFTPGCTKVNCGAASSSCAHDLGAIVVQADTMFERVSCRRLTCQASSTTMTS